MKRIAMCLLILLLSAGTAYALPTTLTDVTGFTETGTNPAEDLNGYGWGDANKLDGIFDYVAWTHHYDLEPYTEIYSGTLTLALVDNEHDRPFRPWTWELAFGYTESGDWDFGEVDTGDYSYNLNVAFLEDGGFSVVLASLGGDFYIDSSTLAINYDTAPAPVPDPATILLMGIGMAGIAGLEQRRRKKSQA